MSQEREHPRVFVSYSWSSDEHVQWVVDFATRLVHDGVEVVLDKWDLKEGQDKYAFMEQMVSAPDIEKVLIVSDIRYAKRADAREGGVGTESQIVSPEVYQATDQEKFIPVVTELFDDGRPALPAYLHGRIYVDFSDAQKEPAEYEKLVRNIYGKPLFQRPALGEAPAFVREDDATASEASAKLRHYRDAVLRGRPHIRGAYRDYLDSLLETITGERLSPEAAQENSESIDDLVVNSLERLRTHRDQFQDSVQFSARYDAYADFGRDLHHFFERLFEESRRRPEGPWNEAWADNLTFMLRELFLVTVSVAIRDRFYTPAVHLLNTSYFSRSYGDGFHNYSFGVLDQYFRTLDEVRNRRLRLGRLSVTADIVRERAQTGGPELQELIDAEVLLYTRSVLDLWGAEGADQFGDYWYPRLLVFRSRGDFSGRIRERLKSRSYFADIAPLLGVEDAQHLREKIDSLPEGEAQVRIGFSHFSSDALGQILGIDTIGSVP